MESHLLSKNMSRSCSLVNEHVEQVVDLGAADADWSSIQESAAPMPATAEAPTQPRPPPLLDMPSPLGDAAFALPWSMNDVSLKNEVNCGSYVVRKSRSISSDRRNRYRHIFTLQHRHRHAESIGRTWFIADAMAAGRHQTSASFSIASAITSRLRLIL